jgi:hypothetical protein
MHERCKRFKIHLSEELARKLTVALGYSFDDARIVRMAKGVREIVGQGLGGVVALEDAFFDEIAIYGDPLAPAFEFKGLVNA